MLPVSVCLFARLSVSRSTQKLYTILFVYTIWLSPKVLYSQLNDLTLKLQNVIEKGKLPKISFMYIYLNNVFDHALADLSKSEFE